MASSLERLPPLVRRAEELAAGLGFERSCEPAVGRLLHALAAQRGRLRVGEVGTGVGVGAAWIVSALQPDVPFFSAELDPVRAAAAGALFRDDPNAHVLEGDWRDVLAPEAPFDLLFVDAGPSKADAALPGLVAPRGTVVLDDLAAAAEPDPVREFWRGNRDFVTAELSVTPATGVLIAVRVR